MTTTILLTNCLLALALIVGAFWVVAFAISYPARKRASDEAHARFKEMQQRVEGDLAKSRKRMSRHWGSE